MQTAQRLNVAGANYPQPSYAWFVVTVLVATTIISYTDRQILSLLVDPIRLDLSISDTQVGLLMGSAFAFVYGIAGIPLGWLADRSSRRNLIVLGVLLWSAGTVCCGLAHNFTQFFLARMVVGVGEAVLTPASISMISDCFPPQKRGAPTTAFLMGLAMGGGGAILFGGLILRLFDSGILKGSFLDGEASWRLVLLFLGILGIIPALVIATLKEPKRQINENLILPSSSESTAAASPGVATLVAGDWIRLSPLLLGMGITSLVDNAVLAWTPSLLVRSFHMTASDVGQLLGLLLMVAGGLGMMAGGIFSGRARQKNPGGGGIYVGIISASLATLITSLIMINNLDIVLLGVTIYVVLSCIGAAVGVLALLDQVPNQQHGLVMAISFFLNVALGAGVGPVAVALAADHLALPGSGIGWAIFVVACPGFLLVTGLYTLAFRNTRRRR